MSAIDDYRPQELDRDDDFEDVPEGFDRILAEQAYITLHKGDLHYDAKLRTIVLRVPANQPQRETDKARGHRRDIDHALAALIELQPEALRDPVCDVHLKHLREAADRLLENAMGNEGFDDECRAIDASGAP